MIAEDAKKEKDHMTPRERAEFTRRWNAAVERIRKATGGFDDCRAPSAGCYDTDCFDCKTKWWMQEVEK